MIFTTNTSSALIVVVSPRLGGSSGTGSASILLRIVVDVGEQLDHDPIDGRVPGDGHGADPELLGDRSVQRVHIALPWSEAGGTSISPALRRTHLVQHLVQVLGQHGDLLLLAGHAGDPVALARLQEEGPLPRLPHGSGDEPVRGVIAVHQNRHAHQTMPPFLLVSRPSPTLDERPTGTSGRHRVGGAQATTHRGIRWRRARRRRLLGRGANIAPRSAVLELTVITKGRVAV